MLSDPEGSRSKMHIPKNLVWNLKQPLFRVRAVAFAVFAGLFLRFDINLDSFHCWNKALNPKP